MKRFSLLFIFLTSMMSQQTVRVCLIESDKPVLLSFKSVAILYAEEGRYQFTPDNEPTYVFSKNGLIHFESKGKYPRALKYKDDNDVILKTIRNDNYIEVDTDFHENGPLTFRLNDDGKLQIIAEISLKRYLNYVVPNEIIVKEDKHYEAIKAQTVAARSYVISKMDVSKPFDVYSDTRDQVYRSAMQIPDIVINAVNETEGIVMMYEGDVLLTMFCSTIGGRREYPYYLSGDSIFMDVTDNTGSYFGTTSPLYRWERSFEIKEIHDRLMSWFPDKFSITDTLANINLEVSVDKLNRSGRVQEMTLSDGNESVTLKGLTIRQFFRTESKILPSRLFVVYQHDNTLLLRGGGFGHGEGLGQYEAMEMAEKRYNFLQILKYFYPKAEVAWLEY